MTIIWEILTLSMMFYYNVFSAAKDSVGSTISIVSVAVARIRMP